MRTHVRLAREGTRPVEALANIALLRANQRSFEEGVGLGEISTVNIFLGQGGEIFFVDALAEYTQKLPAQI